MAMYQAPTSVPDPTLSQASQLPHFVRCSAQEWDALKYSLKPSEWTSENHDIIWRVGDGYGGEYHDVDKP
jgi:hypothetical protein